MTEKKLADWLEHISQQHAATIDMGLERMQVMIQRLGLQQPGCATAQVVTIAGTNGKGSTAVALEYMLLQAGKRVGTTLSPHIRRFNERVRVGGEEVDDLTLCTAFAAVEAARQQLPLTYFEYAALAALWTFKHAQVDVAILEIGLGGRLDAFNAIDADVAVITSIGIDHQEFLGNTLDAIGAEKAGILRSGQAVITGPHMPLSVLDACRRLTLQPRSYGDDFSIESTQDGQHWLLYPVTLDNGQPPLQFPIGELAGQNIAVAFEAAMALLEDEQIPAVVAGLQHIGGLRFAGRLQICEYQQRRWILDVAHNPAGVQFLLAQLQARRLHPQAIICAMLRNKDHATVARMMCEAYSVPWLLLDSFGERGLPAAELQLATKNAMQGRCECVTDARAAAAWVSSATAPGDVILVFGSFNAVEQFAWLDAG